MGVSRGSAALGKVAVAIERHGTVLAPITIAFLLCWWAFIGEGGLSLGKTTAVWVTAVPISALVVAISVVKTGASRLNGWLVLSALGALTLLAGVSVAWSLVPDLSWLEFNRMLAYLALTSATVALVRIWPAGWQSLLLGLSLTVVVLVLYALATKVAPAWLATDEPYGRLRAPFHYWNALGLVSAFGLILGLWLGTSKQLPRLLNLAAYPFVGICVVALMLSFSRGSLAAAVAVVALWFVLLGPLRMPSITVIGIPTLLAVPLVAWVFSNPDLTESGVELALRRSAGIELGIFLIIFLALVSTASLIVERLSRSRPLSPDGQRRVGVGLLVLVALVPAASVLALTFSSKGLGGSIESGWRSLTSESAEAPPNLPGRFTSTASYRATYWHETGRIWKDHRYKGAGAGSYEVVRRRYRKVPIIVAHAHGQIPQALADLGLAGVFLTLLAGFAWLLAAARTLELRTLRSSEWSDERIGLATLSLIVLGFGLHAAIDWTWYVPGVVIPALVAAGWIAGRGPIGQQRLLEPAATRAQQRVRIGAAAITLAIALFTVWTILLPLRSEHASQRALELAQSREFSKARSEAIRASELNPTSVEPYYTLSAIEKSAGKLDAALRPLEQAVQLQPANPDAWAALGRYQLLILVQPQKAIPVLEQAVFLDPKEYKFQEFYVRAAEANQVRLENIRKAKAERVEAKRRARKQRQAQAAPSTTVTPAEPEQR